MGFGLLLGAYGLLHVRWAFYLLAFPHGVVWSGLLTATMATLGQVLPAERRADGLSVYGLASPAGSRATSSPPCSTAAATAWCTPW
jgi:hypothetical protein